MDNGESTRTCRGISCKNVCMCACVCICALTLVCVCTRWPYSPYRQGQRRSYFTLQKQQHRNVLQTIYNSCPTTVYSPNPLIDTHTYIHVHTHITPHTWPHKAQRRMWQPARHLHWRERRQRTQCTPRGTFGCPPVTRTALLAAP